MQKIKKQSKYTKNKMHIIKFAKEKLNNIQKIKIY